MPFSTAVLFSFRRVNSLFPHDLTLVQNALLGDHYVPSPTLEPSQSQVVPSDSKAHNFIFGQPKSAKDTLNYHLSIL